VLLIYDECLLWLLQQFCKVYDLTFRNKDLETASTQIVIHFGSILPSDTEMHYALYEWKIGVTGVIRQPAKSNRLAHPWLKFVLVWSQNREVLLETFCWAEMITLYTFAVS